MNTIGSVQHKPMTPRDKARRDQESADARLHAEHIKNVRRKDIKGFFQIPDGRRFYRRLLFEVCDIHGKNSDRREVGVEILAMLEAAEPQAMKILYETKEQDEHGL